MEETCNILDNKEAFEGSGTEIGDVDEIMNLQGEQDEEKEDENNVADNLRERKTSREKIYEFISRNGLQVDKLPTFHHLYISEISHKVLNFQDKIHSEFVRQWRSVVTGDPNK